MRIKRSEIFYLIGTIILCVRNFNIYSLIINIDETVDNIALIVIYLCFIISFILNKLTIKELRNILYYFDYWCSILYSNEEY